MKGRKIAGRALLVVFGLAIGLKAMDVVVGRLDPCGISHFTYQNLFVKTCIDRRAVPPGATLMDFPIPNSRADANVVYQINSLGFRGHEYSKSKPEGTWRIVVLGDSVTFGWGVSVEDRFTDVIEQRLQKAAPPGKHVEIVNLAVPGYQTGQEWYAFKTQAMQYSPDAVIVVFNRNDVENDTQEAIDLQGLSRKRIENAGFHARIFVDEPWKSWLEATLPNLRLLGVYRYVYLITEHDAEVVTQQYAAMTNGIAISLKLLLEMKKTCEQQGIPFGVADLHDVVPIRDGLAALQIPYRSISYPNDISDMSLRNSAVDPHPNTKGHLLLAERFEKALAEFGMLPKER